MPVAAPPVEMMVEESVFYNIGDEEAQDEWNKTAPGAAFNHLRLGPDRRTLALGMVHELHCLRHLQRVIEYGLKESRIEHTHHCLTYVRQWVLCSADVAMEPGDFDSQRVGATHTCRDWEAVYALVNKNWKGWTEYRMAREAGEL